jgi:thioredoxin reductase (NADPH)
MRKVIVILLLGVFLQSSKDIPIQTCEPEPSKIYPIAIIGAGAAGTMAVNHAILNNREVLIFTGAKLEQKRSSARWVKQVDNVPGLEKYKRPVVELRNEVLEKLFQGPFSRNLFVIEDSIRAITKQDGVFKLQDASNRTYLAKYVVLATGIMQVQPHIQGSIRAVLDYANGQTICYCCLCDGHRSFGKKTAVIGYKEVAANVALTLQEKYRPTNMTILTNGHPAEFTPELLAELKKYNIPILEAPIQEIMGNKELKQLRGFKLETGAVIDAEISFVALGIRPNNQLAQALGAKLYENGLVVTDANGESSVPNLFVIGDLQGGSFRQIYTAWQHAADAIQAIDDRL